MDRSKALRTVALAWESSVEHRCHIQSVKHALLLAVKAHEDQISADEQTVHGEIALDLLATMSTCAMALNQLAGEMGMGIINPLQIAVNELGGNA
ncbi:hypothetical protein ACVDG3_15940 [Meridianimarinicoccus sp. RP-17]|uniref:hypothetical protein n=1 Tax=Meridianimarinicoccus zhengii TaxID=2056810 RepID=UPI000DAD39F2|nr:hypothetical protein [Phycocomes zhengii]